MWWAYPVFYLHGQRLQADRLLMQSQKFPRESYCLKRKIAPTVFEGSGGLNVNNEKSDDHQTKDNHWTGFTSVCHGGASAGIMECTECVHHSLEVHWDSATCPPTWATEELTYLGRTPGWSESHWWGLRDRAGLSCSPAGCFELSSSRSKFWWDKTCPYFMSVWVGATEVNRSDASLFSNVFDSSVDSKIKQKAF